MTTQRDNCLEYIYSLLQFLEKSEEMLLFCSNNEQSIQRKVISSTEIQNKYHISDYFSKCLSLQSTIKEIQEEFTQIGNNIETDEKLISPNFYSLLGNQIGQYVDSAQSANRTLESFLAYKTEIEEYLQTMTNSTRDQHLRNVLIAFVNTMLTHIVPDIEKLYVKIPLIKTFYVIREIQKNIVMIGPNGCGKSTFAREMSKQLGLGATVIPAQKLFFYNTKENFSVDTNPQKIQQFQKSEKSGKDKDWEMHQLHKTYILDLDTLINHLISRHISQASKEHEENTSKTPTLLEKVITIWEQIIIHRQLKYNHGSFRLHAAMLDNGKQYPFMHLSDGEKAVFYYIANVMLTETNSYIIVDEPENHLNLAIVNQLWDRLEQERKDCQFIYLTHNPDFVIGRSNSSILWIKDFFSSADGNFDYSEILSIKAIDNRLMIELVGSRKNILFCEGDKSSLDYQVYSILFPECTVTPVGGCKEVINHTRTYNNTEFFRNSAIGIIDSDFRTDEEIELLKESFIYCLWLPEIENLLCDEILLSAGVNQFYPTGPITLGTTKKKLFLMLHEKKEEQATLYAHYITNETMKEEFPDKQNSLDDLLEKYRNFNHPDIDKVTDLYNERLGEIQIAIQEENFEKSLELYNCKSIITIGGPIVDDYKNRIIGVLQDDQSMQKKLREKYFGDIPNGTTD